MGSLIHTNQEEMVYIPFPLNKRDFRGYLWEHGRELVC